MKALVVVDVQKDFCKGGSLAVPQGDEVVSVINKLMASGDYDLVVSTLDWHPRSHKSFASNNEGKKVGEMSTLGGLPQVMWPDHCVMNTKGSEYHEDLDVSKIQKSFNKGCDENVDSYSGFYDNGKKHSTGLGEFLKEQGVKEVDVVGLALDYCVKATAEDSHSLGFKTRVVLEATRAVNLNPEDGTLTVKSLKEQGVEVVQKEGWGGDIDLKKVYEKALSLFKDENKTKKWMRSRVLSLGEKTPEEMILEGKSQEVLVVLLKIEHGIY